MHYLKNNLPSTDDAIYIYDFARNENQRGPKLQTDPMDFHWMDKKHWDIFQNNRKKVIQVWNYMRASKWWQILHLGNIYYIKYVHLRLMAALITVFIDSP